MKYFLYITLILGALMFGSGTTTSNDNLVPAYNYENTYASGGNPVPMDENENASVAVNISAGFIEGDVSTLDNVFLKLKSLKHGKDEILTILHIGDSHIQAGYFPDAVRKHFQSDFGNAGRGLVIPLRITGTNEPSDYAIKSPNRWAAAKSSEWSPAFEVGLGGVAISTGERNVEFTITCRHNPFNQITAFHHPRAPLLVEDSLFSIGISCDFANTEISTFIVLNRSTDSITLRATVNDPNYDTPTFYGFSLENGSNGVLYHSVGVNGCSCEHYNRSPQITDQFSLLEPDLIIVSLGTNDAYEKFSSDNNYASIDKLIKTLIEKNPGAAIMLTTPMECFSRRGRTYSVNKYIPAVRDNIIKVASELGLVYWDMYTAAGGKGAMDKWYKDKLARQDRLHLTVEGYNRLGDMMYSAFGNSYNNYLKQ